MNKVYILIALLIIGSSFIYAQTEEWLWAQQAGGSTSDAGYSIATDHEGNSYITGYFYGTATFGSITLSTSTTSYMDSDIFIAKLDPAGNFLWVKQAGGPSNDCGKAIATDSEGNCYVIGHFTAGYYAGSASFGPITFDIGGSCISKLDTNGNWLWSQKVSYSGNATALSTDSSGHCYLTGDFRGSQTFGGTTLSSSSGSFFDLFVAKLDTSGNWLWARQAGGSSGSQLNNAWGAGIANDSDGNCYLTGYFDGTVSFGSTSYTTGTYIDYGTYNCRDIFISKLDTIGNWQWTKRSSGSRNAAGYSIATDSSGNSHVTGVFEATSSFGDTTLNSRGSNDIFIARLDGNGDWLWTKQAGGTNTDYAQAIATDSSGNSYLTGYFRGTASFGTTPLTCTGDTDIFIAKLNISGDWLWAQRAGGSYDKGQGIATDSDDNCYLTGYFTGNAVFGDHTLSNIGVSNGDIYIAKLGIPVSAEDALPKPPENVQILMDGIDAVISWDAVTQSIMDTPIVPDYYLVFFNSFGDLDEPYILLGSSPDLSYTHVAVGENSEHTFYLVRAYKGRGQIARDLSALGLTPGMTEAEVIRILREQERRN